MHTPSAQTHGPGTGWSHTSALGFCDLRETHATAPHGGSQVQSASVSQYDGVIFVVGAGAGLAASTAGPASSATMATGDGVVREHAAMMHAAITGDHGGRRMPANIPAAR